MKRCMLLAAAAVGLLAGCSGNEQPYVTSQRLERGLVIVLPGIEGRSSLNEEICRGLYEGGVRSAIELYDWTHDWTAVLGPLWNLRASGRNHRKAREIAEHIADYRKECPDAPVVLVGQSGGGAIAVWVAEELGPGQQVDGIILLAASLSPQYALDAALRNSKRGIVSFHSHKDWLLLGTNVAGTMDGQLTSSAGRTGFEYPADQTRPGCYDKLYQIPWTQYMAGAGNTGGHLTSGEASFVAYYAAPFVRSRTWNDEFVDRVVRQDRAQRPDAFVVDDQPPRPRELTPTRPRPASATTRRLGPSSSAATRSDADAGRSSPRHVQPERPAGARPASQPAPSLATQPAPSPTQKLTAPLRRPVFE